MTKRLALAGLLGASLSAVAAGTATPDDPATPAVAAGTYQPGPASLLADLDRYLHQRKVAVDGLGAEQMVAVMIDWYRFVPIDADARGALVFRYGGWSEGCATGFRLSLLRRAGTTEQLAGITMLFEPSAPANLAPYTTATSDWDTLEAFLDAVQASPAYRRFGTAKPMAVMLERGGLR
jgi:hypothetical protein